MKIEHTVTLNLETDPISPKCERCGKQDITVRLVTYFVRANSMAETKQLCQNCKPLFVRYLAKI